MHRDLRDFELVTQGHGVADIFGEGEGVGQHDRRLDRATLVVRAVEWWLGGVGSLEASTGLRNVTRD